MIKSKEISHYHHYYEFTLFMYLITLLALQSSIIHIISLYLRLSSFVFCLSIIETFAYTQHNITFLLLSCCIKSLLLYINDLTLIREGARDLEYLEFRSWDTLWSWIDGGDYGFNIGYYTLFTFIRSYGSTLLFHAVMYSCTYQPVFVVSLWHFTQNCNQHSIISLSEEEALVKGLNVGCLGAKYTWSSVQQSKSNESDERDGKREV